MKINKLTDYSIVLLSHFGEQRYESAGRKSRSENLGKKSYAGRVKDSCGGEITVLKTARELSRDTRIPYPTVVKLLKNLHHKNLLRSKRGIKGGYFLARPAAQISVREVIEAVEGPLALTQCISAAGRCLVAKSCPAQSNWNKINNIIADTLSDLKITELTSEQRQKKELTERRQKKGLTRAQESSLKNAVAIEELKYLTNDDA